MEQIIEDALTIQNYLPWVENDEDIINFMRRIPLDNSYLRIPITIKFFLNSKDSNITEQQIEKDAKDVVTILPIFPYKEVKNQLRLLGNIDNRKEVLLRILLNDSKDLDNILNQMNHETENRKRSLTQQKEITNNKIRRFENNNISEVLNVSVPSSTLPKESKLVIPTHHKIIQPARFIAPNNAVGTNLQIKPLLPAISEQVPEVFQLTQAMPEERHNPPILQQLTSDKLLIPSSKYLSSTEVKDTPAFPLLDLSKAGPSKENATNGILIDLVENDLPSIKKERVLDEKLVLRLIEMFPDTCPDYIREICDNKKWPDFDDLVTNIIENEDHPKRQKSSTPPGEVDPDDQFETVKALLPDADPTYLRMKCEMLEYKPEELNKFIIEARERKDYPTMKEYLRNQQLSAQSKQYTTEFSIEKFVELFPEPHITFNDPKRIINVDNYSKMYITQYFQNKYDKLPKRAIYNILVQNNFKILQTNSQLALIKNSSLKMKSRRKPTTLDNNINNILVLQEIAYLEHKEEIESFINAIKEKEEEDRQYSKENGLMNTCQCCFDDEVMPKDTFNCPKECLFCKSCIRKSCEIAFGEGRTNFKCLNDCPEEFTLQILQSILMPKMFSKIAQKKMIEEIKAAGIEDLETCPFCDFASIPNDQDKIFKCLNPECMKESCRNCREPNHIPLHCDEIEKDENVQARLFLENKMTEALLCKCWKCGTSFFKEEGCNKMTCTCGAQMCYVCKKPVDDYTHFNGMGGDKYHLCPLYSDTNHLNRQKVETAVEQAKAQIDQSKLKVDPSANLQQYYENQSNRLPREPHLDLLRNLQHDLARANILLGRARNRHHRHHNH